MVSLQAEYKIYWFVVTTTYFNPQCSTPKTVYDSAFQEVLLSIIKALGRVHEKPLKVSIMDTETQPTLNDCGIFAIAMMVTIAYDGEPFFVITNTQ